MIGPGPVGRSVGGDWPDTVGRVLSMGGGTGGMGRGHQHGRGRQGWGGWGYDLLRFVIRVSHTAYCTELDVLYYYDGFAFDSWLRFENRE